MNAQTNEMEIDLFFFLVSQACELIGLSVIPCNGGFSIDGNIFQHK